MMTMQLKIKPVVRRCLLAAVLLTAAPLGGAFLEWPLARSQVVPIERTKCLQRHVPGDRSLPAERGWTHQAYSSITRVEGNGDFYYDCVHSEMKGWNVKRVRPPEVELQTMRMDL